VIAVKLIFAILVSGGALKDGHPSAFRVSAVMTSIWLPSAVFTRNLRLQLSNSIRCEIRLLISVCVDRPASGGEVCTRKSLHTS